MSDNVSVVVTASPRLRNQLRGLFEGGEVSATLEGEDTCAGDRAGVCLPPVRTGTSLDRHRPGGLGPRSLRNPRLPRPSCATAWGNAIVDSGFGAGTVF